MSNKIDYDALFGENYNPCEALDALRPAFMKARVSGIVKEVKFRDRSVVFGETSLTEFKSLISELESECAARNGTPRRKSAIKGGFRKSLNNYNSNRRNGW